MTVNDSAAIVNPFRQRLRWKHVSFKTSVWQANELGKDSSSGKTDFALNDEFLWIAYDFSVPLRWITSVDPLGPGFVVTWRNRLSGEDEGAAFCVRTMFGYNLKKRDELVASVSAAARAAAARPEAPAISAARAFPRCQVCHAPEQHVYDFNWLFSVVAFWISKPDRGVLCRTHARRRFRTLATSNLIAGNLGFGAFISPIFSLANVREARKAHAIGSTEAFVWTALGFWPYALFAWIVIWAIWYAVTF
ncbi:MAG TPA: hypothetical protein VLU46_10055 [Thermoanaerobaculia bacterium]|nr:hypothetical protein [Thermoanaerobaculia bacterium]